MKFFNLTRYLFGIISFHSTPKLFHFTETFVSLHAQKTKRQIIVTTKKKTDELPKRAEGTDESNTVCRMLNISSLMNYVDIAFTNLYDCAYVDLVDEDGNQNCAGAAVILPPMNASCWGAEVTLNRVEEEAGYDHYRMEEAVAICADYTAEVNAAETSVVVENRRSHICREKLEDVAAASVEVTTICRREVEDVDWYRTEVDQMRRVVRAVDTAGNNVDKMMAGVVGRPRNR